MKKPAKEGFRCSVCSKWHDALPTDMAFKLPDEIWKLEYLESYQRARYNPDFCTLDSKRYFIRCVLPVPFTHTQGFFAWGVWVEVTKNYHDLYLAHFYEGSTLVPPFEGLLANNLKGYRKSLGLKVIVELSDEHRPFIQLLPSSRHMLAVEQRRGIDLSRHHEFVTPGT
jgi:hypothetical protein